MLSKNVTNKKCALKLIFFNENKIEKYSDDFPHRKLSLKVKLGHFLTPSQYTNYQNYFFLLLVFRFLGKNLSKFVTPA